MNMKNFGAQMNILKSCFTNVIVPSFVFLSPQFCVENPVALKLVFLIFFLLSIHSRFSSTFVRCRVGNNVWRFDLSVTVILLKLRTKKGVMKVMVCLKSVSKSEFQ